MDTTKRLRGIELRYVLTATVAKEGVMSFLEKRPAVYPDKVSANMPDFFPWYGPRPYE